MLNNTHLTEPQHGCKFIIKPYNRRGPKYIRGLSNKADVILR